MCIMKRDATITLTETAFKLGIPKHEIIYLCEKQVIIPVVDAKGRGSSRLFSEQNIFELLLALELKKYNISTHTITIFVRLLKKFVKIIEKQFDENFLDQITNKQFQFFLMIQDGEFAYFRMTFPGKQSKGQSEKILIGLDLNKLEAFYQQKSSEEHEQKSPKWRNLTLAARFGIPDDIVIPGGKIKSGPCSSRLEINLSELAKNSYI